MRVHVIVAIACRADQKNQSLNSKKWITYTIQRCQSCGFNLTVVVTHTDSSAVMAFYRVPY